MAHEFCWIELSTDNQDGAKAFYSKLFGWSFDDNKTPDGGVYSMFQPEAGGPGGGMMTKPGEEVPTAWLPYVMVDDINESVSRVKELGGSVHVEPTPIPDCGFFAIIADPSGGTLGLWHKMSEE